MEDKNAKKILDEVRQGFNQVNKNIENLAISTQQQFFSIDDKFDFLEEKVDNGFNKSDIKMNQIHRRIDEVIDTKVDRRDFDVFIKR